MEVVGEGCEYFLVVLEQEGMVVVDAVKDKHVQGIDHVFATHEGIQA